MNFRGLDIPIYSLHFHVFLDSAPKFSYFLGMCFPGAISLRVSVDSWTPGGAKTMQNHWRVSQNQGFTNSGKVCFQAPILVHFGDLWAQQSHFFVIFRGFIFRFKIHEIWNPKSIQRYPKVSGSMSPGPPRQYYFKRFFSYFTRRIEARGQKAKCKKLGIEF